MEIARREHPHETATRLESRLIHGSYPEVVLMDDDRDRQEYLEDILEMDGIRQSAKISCLLSLIAFQIGREVSCTELGTSLGMSKNFNPLGMRNDVGELWENYLVIERLKRQEYLRMPSNNYFWRTNTQHELDLVEERDGRLFGYEMKFSFIVGDADA